MAITARVYKNGALLGTGTATPGARDITAYTAYNPGLGSDRARRCGSGRNVQVVCSGGASSNGVFSTRITLDGTLLAIPTTTLSTAKACPFV